MGESTSAADLTAGFRRLHEALTHTGDVDSARQHLVELACGLVDGCDWATITAWPAHHRPSTLVSTGAVAESVDRLQYDSGEGPCLSVAADQAMAWIPDLYGENRWPRFVRQALSRTPVRGVLAYHLSWTPFRSALNLYARTADALDWAAVNTGAEVATHAAILMAHAEAVQKAGELERALRSSRQIGAAIGILMETHGISAEAALDMLRGTSNRLNRKLKDIAGEVTSTGQLPR